MMLVLSLLFIDDVMSFSQGMAVFQVREGFNSVHSYSRPSGIESMDKVTLARPFTTFMSETDEGTETIEGQKEVRHDGILKLDLFEFNLQNSILFIIIELITDCDTV
jgi:nucleoid DNA-binding protein